jgi:hypothetical protein
MDDKDFTRNDHAPRHIFVMGSAAVIDFCKEAKKLVERCETALESNELAKAVADNESNQSLNPVVNHYRDLLERGTDKRSPLR